MAMALYLRDQFVGWAGSFSLSQSTSNWGSAVPVVPTEVTRWAREGADVREACAVNVLPTTSILSTVSPDELDSAMEFVSATADPSLWSGHFSWAVVVVMFVV